MQKKILVFELCTELEQELVRQQLNPDTLKRYRRVLKEFSVFGGEEVYSQSLGTEFLIQKFRADGGVSITDEHSRTEAYYFKCMRILAEYYNFGIVHIRKDIMGEIIWPDGSEHVQKHIWQSLSMAGFHTHMSTVPEMSSKI